MGHLNQLTDAQRHRGKFRGPFLEIGSRDYGSTMNLRDVFTDDTYVGIDMLEGKSVDFVLDLTRPFEEVDAALGGRHFGSVFCLSVLEHCSQPFTMAETITRLLRPGGAAYISVPYAWVFHGYPSDYWRFTHEGVKKLVPDLVFDEAECAFSTDIDGDFRPLDNELSRIHFSTTWHRKRGHAVRGLASGLLRGTRLAHWITRHRYVMPPTMVDMIGTKPQ